jgi:hypothetical protein
LVPAAEHMPGNVVAWIEADSSVGGCFDAWGEEEAAAAVGVLLSSARAALDAGATASVGAEEGCDA